MAVDKLKVLDLFSGIGGFSLGLERAGMETVAFCENDKHCQEVLKKHWPDIPIHDDIEQVSGYAFKLDILPSVDVICGGPPCQGYSVAGQQKGGKDERSELWREYLRIAREVRPKYCILENSPNIRNHTLGEILKAFSEIGYDAEWSIISAYSIGAPHQRERFYCVFWRRDISYPNPFRWFQADLEKEKASSWWWAKRWFKRSPLFKQAAKIKSRVLQFDDGVSKELLECEEKVKMLGNSVLPQIVELIGKAIMKNEVLND